MKNALIKWISVLAVAVSQTSWAAPMLITDTVIVGSQEWAQVYLFTDNNWNTINGQCPAGECSAGSTLNGWDLDGWTWASIDAIQALFNAYTGQTLAAPAYFLTVNSTWAPTFINDFTPTWPNQGPATLGLSSSEMDEDQAYAAYIEDRPPSWGDFDEADTGQIFPKAQSSRALGAWFVRDANPVPAPATMWLVMAGFLGMIGVRGKSSVKV